MRVDYAVFDFIIFDIGHFYRINFDPWHVHGMKLKYFIETFIAILIE